MEVSNKEPIMSTLSIFTQKGDLIISSNHIVSVNIETSWESFGGIYVVSDTTFYRFYIDIHIETVNKTTDQRLTISRRSTDIQSCGEKHNHELLNELSHSLKKRASKLFVEFLEGASITVDLDKMLDNVLKDKK